MRWTLDFFRESFGDSGIRSCQSPELRAELVLALLRMGRFEDAVDGALPLVGTTFEVWFLYTRAWQTWDSGDLETARGLLKDALKLRGQTKQEPAEFLVVDGRPVILSVFSRVVSVPDTPACSPEETARGRRVLPSLMIEEIDSPSRADQLFAYLYPRLTICVTGYPYGTEDPPDYPGDLLFWRALNDPECRYEMAFHLSNLWLEFPYRVGLTVSSVVFLLLVEEVELARTLCRAFIAQRPYVSLVRALHLVSLYRAGLRFEALREGEWLLAKERRDSLGFGHFFMALLAAKEGRGEVAARFAREAVTRRPDDLYAFELDELIMSRLL